MSNDKWYSVPQAIRVNESTYRLASANGGEVEIATQDTRGSGAELEVRHGAVARVIRTSSSAKAPNPAFRGTYCIMPLMFECGTNKVIGACFGFWWECNG